MDFAKNRIFLGVCGAVLGFAGVLALCAAIIVALAEHYGWLIATSSVGGTLVIIASICVYFFLRPFVTSHEEIEAVEETAASALADLPLDIIEAQIQKSPLAAVGLALVAGYAGARDPEKSLNQMQGWLMRLL